MMISIPCKKIYGKISDMNMSKQLTRAEQARYISVAFYKI
jgi:hypothetical protein